MKAKVCKNYTDPTAPPGCLMEPDERYTMDFSSIGEEPIYWCSVCGPQAQAIDLAIRERCLSEPGFIDKFKDAIEEAKEEQDSKDPRGTFFDLGDYSGDPRNP